MGEGVFEGVREESSVDRLRGCIEGGYRGEVSRGCIEVVCREGCVTWSGIDG